MWMLLCLLSFRTCYGCLFLLISYIKQQSMVQCPESHLFYRTCMKSYGANLLGMHDPKINCIDRSGCAAPIPESELRWFLLDGMMKLWERVKQRKEIEAAGLGGLEECPFCDYAVIIDDAEDKTVRYGNLGVCCVVSCRTFTFVITIHYFLNYPCMLLLKFVIIQVLIFIIIDRAKSDLSALIRQFTGRFECFATLCCSSCSAREI